MLELWYNIKDWSMFVEETVIPGGYGGGMVVEEYPAYGLGGFGGAGCCPIPCSPCCFPGVYYWTQW